MDTGREDFGIAIRSAFLKKGTQQRFSLFALLILSVFLMFIEKIETKPLNVLRSIIKDGIYRSSTIVSAPAKGYKSLHSTAKSHFFLYEKNEKLTKEIKELKNIKYKNDFLVLENTQLRKLIDENASSLADLINARVMIDKQSPYLNSFIINSGSNKKIKNGMAVTHGKNFIGRIVDVNFFTSRVLLVSDLNSKIPVLVEPSGAQAILSGHNDKELTLDFLPKNHQVKNGDKVYTSGKEGIFSPGIPIGKVKMKLKKANVSLFSDLKQVTFINIDVGVKK